MLRRSSCRGGSWMTPSTLTEKGRALFGESWQADTSRALGVNDRTVRRWMVNGVPDWVENAMNRLLAQRATVIERLTQETCNE